MTKSRKYYRDGTAAPDGFFEVLCDGCGKHVETGRMLYDKVLKKVIDLCGLCVAVKAVGKL